ncbi:MAG: MFS transporter [Anaerolineaceae bacterium]
MVIFTPMRMLSPFLPAFSRGMGEDLTTISMAVRASMGASAIGPFLAPIAERRGRRVGMLPGLLFFLFGVALFIFWPSIQAFFLALFLVNLGDNVYAPAAQAYLGNQTPYAQRGTALAIPEMGWSLSFILGVPLVGLLIARFGWDSPFTAITGPAIFMVLLFLKAIPKDDVTPLAVPMLSDLKTVLKHTPAIAGLTIGMTMLVGYTVFNLVFGVWMEDSYSLKITALGLVAIGAWLAPLFYAHGIWSNALACAVLDLIAILVLTQVKITNIG